MVCADPAGRGAHFRYLAGVFSRLRRKQAFYQSGRDHTYHRLVKRGMDSGRAVMTMHFAALILECVAFVAVSLAPLQANAVFLPVSSRGFIFYFILDMKGELADLFTFSVYVDDGFVTARGSVACWWKFIGHQGEMLPCHQ